jgi:ribokinase
MRNVLVIGSLNADLVIKTERIPQIGETVNGYDFCINAGGKGANQAVAASKMGANVKMLGCVGADGNGEMLINILESNGVDCTNVLKISDSATGTAVITVVEGDNMIVLDHGANYRLKVQNIEKREELFEWADIVVMQLEIPMDSVLAGAKLSKKHGAVTILNPAPGNKLPEEMKEYIDILVPNEYEAGIIAEETREVFGREEEIIKKLIEVGWKQVIITLGERGSMLNTGNGIERCPAFNVEVKDTTAAGDSFIGGLSAVLKGSRAELEEVGFASGVSAIAVSRAGAITSIPNRKQVDDFLREKLK